MGKYVQRSSSILTVRRTFVAMVLLALAVMVLGLWGCTTTIIPPPNDRIADDPVTVYIADYGRHSSILLPLDDVPDDERRVEYGYGEWRFFALNEEGVGGVFRALVVPSDGTLSRRIVHGPFEESYLQERLYVRNFHAFDVHRDDAIGLRQKLDERYQDNIETEIFNDRKRLYFVRVDERYSLANNCNPVLARWLTQLGCELRGPALLSSWRVRDAD